MAMRGLPLVRPKCNLLSIIRPSYTPICRASPPSLRILRQLQQPPRQPQSRLFSHTALRSYNQSPDPFDRRQQHPKPPPPTHVDYDPALGDPWYHHRLRSAKPLFSSSPGQIIRSPRTHTVVVVSIALALAFYFYNLETVPISGRKRFNCYSEATLHELGVRQAKHVVYDLERQGGGFLPSWDPRTRMVQRVMDRLIPVSGMEADDNSSGKLNPNTHRDEWEVHVIDDGDLSRANAFVLPGGKVFVYSGLLRLTRSDAQLAAVLSHEIAHNLAKHHAERLSQSVGETFFLGSALMLLAATPFTFVFGYMFGGSLLDLLFSRPMNRMQESEADYIGLMMMAEACYDPREAITFWQRLETVQSQLGMEPPEFMSTHPSNQHRIERITKWLPEAVEKRQASDCVGTQGFAEMFRRAMASGHVISGGM